MFKFIPKFFSYPIKREKKRIWRFFAFGVIPVVFACSENTDVPLQQEGSAQIDNLPSFSEMTNEAGLGDFKHENGAFGKMWFPEQMGSGGGFIDYDGDGWLDVLLVGGGAMAEGTIEEPEALWLYRNQSSSLRREAGGDVTPSSPDPSPEIIRRNTPSKKTKFSLATAQAGLAGIHAYGTGVCVADYDNDGDQDFFFTTLQENFLFRNDSGVFTDVTKSAGLDQPILWSSTAVFFDADRDGWLDLYVANYADWSPEADKWCSLDGKTKVYCGPSMYTGVPSAYYRNNGDGTFTEMTKAAGFEKTAGKSLGVAEFDFNGDGWPDLFVANDGEGDLLYQNNGDGTFTERGMASGFAYGQNGEARAGMGIDAGVVDDSGLPSVFVGNFSEEMIGVYRYSEKGWFIDRSAVSKIGRASMRSLTFGVFLMDAEFDGDLDLFAANGHVYPTRTRLQKGVTYKQEFQLFLNDGDGDFEEANDKIGGVFHQKMVARGTAFGDIDRDGDPDILITENGGPAHIWRNDVSNGNFLRIKLKGRASNRDALGAQLEAFTGTKKMVRRVRTGSSYLSHSELTATFGLGQSTKVDSLIISWPSGAYDRFESLETHQEIHIIEGLGIEKILKFEN